MLVLVGMGLWDERDISCKGLELVRRADEVYVEFYTSKLMGTTKDRLEEFLGRKVTEVGRSDLEENCRWLIERAKERDIVILVPGDPAIATTHSALMLEAIKRDVKVRIVHSSSIVNAICGLTGLHNYRFGKSATVSYPYAGKVSKTPVNVIRQNLSIDAHTILFLDLHPKPMTIGEAIEIMEKADNSILDLFGVGIARAGSEEPFVRCDRLRELKKVDFGPPLHILVILAKTLHFMEFECLRYFASAPKELEELVA